MPKKLLFVSKTNFSYKSKKATLILRVGHFHAAVDHEVLAEES